LTTYPLISSYTHNGDDTLQNRRYEAKGSSFNKNQPLTVLAQP